MKQNVANVITIIKSFLNKNLIWIALLVYALVLPAFITTDLSFRLVLMLSFAALFSRYPAAIIILYTIVYTLFMLVTNSFQLPDYVAPQVYFYLIIYFVTELISPSVARLRDKARSVMEP
ncbi:MAG: hypothetical protein ACE5DX_05875 [Candidatus Dojkabacteria bacterium]